MVSALAIPAAAQDSTMHAGAPGASQPIAVSVGGDVPRPFTLTATVLASMPRRTVRAADHGQPEASYEGVGLGDILARAGAPVGQALRGPAMATYVVVAAADGYRVVFALPELDSAFANQIVLVADRKDGNPLSAREGPVRLIVPADRRPARWERQVVSITVRKAGD